MLADVSLAAGGTTCRRLPLRSPPGVPGLDLCETGEVRSFHRVVRNLASASGAGLEEAADHVPAPRLDRRADVALQAQTLVDAVSAEDKMNCGNRTLDLAAERTAERAALMGREDAGSPGRAGERPVDVSVHDRGVVAGLPRLGRAVGVPGDRAFERDHVADSYPAVGEVCPLAVADDAPPVRVQRVRAGRAGARRARRHEEAAELDLCGS